LGRYCDEKTTFKDIDTDWIDGFKDYLNNTAKDAYKRKNNDESEAKHLSQNSKVSYFNKLRACINQAFEARILHINPLRGIKGFEQAETERIYSTLDEVRLLAKVNCNYPVLKQVFLFSSLTGIRKSDIEKLTWSEVQKFGDYTRIVFKQKKTGGQEYLDINKQAEAVHNGLMEVLIDLKELRQKVDSVSEDKDILRHRISCRQLEDMSDSLCEHGNQIADTIGYLLCERVENEIDRQLKL